MKSNSMDINNENCINGTRKTADINGVRNANLGSSVGGIANPMTFYSITWPVSGNIKCLTKVAI